MIVASSSGKVVFCYYFCWKYYIQSEKKWDKEKDWSYFSLIRHVNTFCISEELQHFYSWQISYVSHRWIVNGVSSCALIPVPPIQSNCLSVRDPTDNFSIYIALTDHTLPVNLSCVNIKIISDLRRSVSSLTLDIIDSYIKKKMTYVLNWLPSASFSSFCIRKYTVKMRKYFKLEKRSSFLKSIEFQSPIRLNFFS